MFRCSYLLRNLGPRPLARQSGRRTFDMDVSPAAVCAPVPARGSVRHASASASTSAVSEALNAVVAFEPVLVNLSGELVSERPTPVFIASGEGVALGAWQPLVQSLQSIGFSGILVPFPAGFSDIEAVADFYQLAIERAQLTPPLMVAHSLGTLCALKFLESYSLSGLVLLNPLPPHNPKETISTLLQDYSKNLASEAESEYVLANVPGVAELLQGLTKVEGVVLEPRAVPALVVLTPADARVLGPVGGAVEATLLHMCGAHEDEERTLLRMPAVVATAEEAATSNAQARNWRNAYSDERCVQAVVNWLDETA